MKEWIIDNKQDLKIVIQEIAFVLEKSKKVKIQASSVRSKSKEQLGYYWSTILPAIADYINDSGACSMKVTKSDVNEIMNRKFFYTETIIDGEMIQIPKSKSGATMEQMREFIDNVIDWATNLGIFIPPPETGSRYD